MSKRIEDLFSRLGGGDGQDTVTVSGGWSPRVNVVEKDDEYLVTAELPGIAKRDVHVRMRGGALTIEGERKQRKEEKGERYRRVESFYGNFYRRFQMPVDADAEKVNASFENGMLEIHIGRRPGATAGREIAIS